MNDFSGHISCYCCRTIDAYVVTYWYRVLTGIYYSQVRIFSFTLMASVEIGK
ncbi:hypothetical protein [Clostridium pasteurianum]|uniref:hypothetical protein n=1 Tax=Clostridium pasteurianum TaxID=1501 RepID=UPI0015C2DB22|nr:hypothetical protein [Clostridium pasteurianum]